MTSEQLQDLMALINEHRQTIAIIAGVLAVVGSAGGMWLSRHLHLKARIRDVVKSASHRSQAGPGRGNDLTSIEKRLRSAEKKKSEKEKKPKRTIEDRLAAAGIPLDPKQFWQLAGLLALVAAALALLFKQGPMMLLLVAVVTGLGLPMLVLAFLGRRRQKQFLTNLPDALDVMVRGLKAGLPVNEALAMIGREFKGPIAREFAIVTDEQAAGFSLGDALERCAKRMPLPEMNMLAIAIAIQAQTGGSLSETLQNLSDVIRARFKLKRKVSAMTSEAKASAGIIGSLPFLLSATIVVVAPEYMNPMFDTLLGNMLATGAFIWMMMGIGVMIKMIHFKV
ncbi:MAG: type II secretion system F family protein [Pseudomonadota bacterium]